MWQTSHEAGPTSRQNQRSPGPGAQRPGAYPRPFEENLMSDTPTPDPPEDEPGDDDQDDDDQALLDEIADDLDEAG